jgi:hypothetical protein
MRGHRLWMGLRFVGLIDPSPARVRERGAAPATVAAPAAGRFTILRAGTRLRVDRR